MADTLQKLLPLWQAIADVPQAAWLRQPRPQTHHKEDPMAATETETPSTAYSDWLENVLMADDGPLPAPVLFGGNPKAEQLELVRVIGGRLRQARELCNLSQQVAAKRLGYSNSSKLSKVEGATDTSSVPLWLILRAAKVYEVSIDYLFGVTDDFETGGVRGVDGWLLDVWEKARARDMAAVARLGVEIAAVSHHIAALVAGVLETAHALDTYRDLNPSFDETRGSATLAGRLERLQEGARTAELALRRFHHGLAGTDSPGGR